MEREAADFVLEVYGFGFAALEFREKIRVEFDSHVLEIEYGAVEEVHADCDVSEFSFEVGVHEFDVGAGEGAAFVQGLGVAEHFGQEVQGFQGFVFAVEVDSYVAQFETVHLHYGTAGEFFDFGEVAGVYEVA